MNKITLAICDVDPDYSENLAKQLFLSGDTKYNVLYFTSLDQLKNFLQREIIHCLLLHETFSTKNLEANKIWYLTEELHFGNRGCYIYKYQAVEQIEKYFMTHRQIVKRGIKKGEIPKKGKKVIGIYSPIGRTGKTTFTKALASTMGEQKEVLHLNLEEYEGENYKTKNSKPGLEDLFYHLHQDDLGRFLSTCVQEAGNYSFILPIKTGEELKKIPVDNWIEVIEKLKSKSIFEVIILELGSAISGFLEVLSQCDVIYIPIRSDIKDQGKLKQFEYNLKKLNQQKILQNIKHIYIPKYETTEKELHQQLKLFSTRLLRKEDLEDEYK